MFPIQLLGSRVELCSSPIGLPSKDVRSVNILVALAMEVGLTGPGGD